MGTSKQEQRQRVGVVVVGVCIGAVIGTVSVIQGEHRSDMRLQGLAQHHHSQLRHAANREKQNGGGGGALGVQGRALPGFKIKMVTGEGGGGRRHLGAPGVRDTRGVAVKIDGKVKTQKMAIEIPGNGPRIVGRGYLITGHDLTGDSGITFLGAVNNKTALETQCKAACVGNKECVAYTYHPSEATCFLKSGVDGVGGEDCGTSNSCWFYGEVKK